MMSTPYFPIKVFLSHSLSEWEQRKYNCLAQGEIDPIFHYTTAAQSHLWKQLFELYSPFSRENGREFYKNCFKEISQTIPSSFPYEIVSLGCGSGEKDHLLLKELMPSSVDLWWTAIDTSLQLLLEACIHCPLNIEKINPILSDILWEDTLKVLKITNSQKRIFTLFGVLPNIDPFVLFKSLETVLSKEDFLILNAHLAPVKSESQQDYIEGIESILYQYDNKETRLWLTEVLRDWGIENKTELFNISFSMHKNFFRIEATVYWKENGRLVLGQGKELKMVKGSPLRLFFSYRFTPERLEEFFSHWSFRVINRWLFSNKEEGIWLLQRI
ncbi:L-histidine N(alpha)-methyltransferase [Methylacidiphilum caldifontis]|uniref:L-histidine N(alpha)-methyltransferase n=1 Tax=Methylacidiphilum caldifontis TaxID=2795386 RepID=UPI001A908D59|nr:L-histidine N(alpha)-methyltransferase [Methylacidiphilum caldifontis]QSR87972.1 L-histidine N(alpha)-methyltransferase [Methylacidiphilum caldifontis]